MFPPKHRSASLAIFILKIHFSFKNKNQLYCSLISCGYGYYFWKFNFFLHIEKCIPRIWWVGVGIFCFGFALNKIKPHFPSFYIFSSPEFPFCCCKYRFAPLSTAEHVAAKAMLFPRKPGPDSSPLAIASVVLVSVLLLVLISLVTDHFRSAKSTLLVSASAMDQPIVQPMNALLEQYFAPNNSIERTEWERALPTDAERQQMRKVRPKLYIGHWV